MIAGIEAKARPLSREEPIALAAALTAETDMDAFIRTQEELCRRHPDSYYPLGECRHCKMSLGDKPEDKVIPFGQFGFLPNVCCKACSEAAKERWAQEDRTAREAMFNGVIPTAFVRWDDSLGNTKAKQRVLSRFGMDTRKGLVLHGTSGTCKTFIAWQLVRLIVEENARDDGDSQRSWLFCDAFELATKGIPAEADRTHFLFIDDLGNEPTSTKFETALLHLIRKRCDWHRPIVITTQLLPREFKARYFQGAAAEAIMRRFREHTIAIDTDNLSTP